MLFLTKSPAIVTAILLVAPALPQGAPQTADAVPQVLFVREHGAAKSVIAAAHFNKLAKERGLPHRAIARGTQPDPVVSPKVVSGLQSEGFTVAQENLSGLLTTMCPAPPASSRWGASCPRKPRLQIGKTCRR
jgi:hypothetical protein